MDPTRDQLFPDARLSEDENRSIRAGGGLDEPTDRGRLSAGTYDLVTGELWHIPSQNRFSSFPVSVPFSGL
ncbi:MAG: hypothetical protein O7J95_18640, partial [Planctomycetota bacterium]|nr:hypothetical protein [Planctomycetota bacterium]